MSLQHLQRALLLVMAALMVALRLSSGFRVARKHGELSEPAPATESLAEFGSSGRRRRRRRNCNRDGGAAGEEARAGNGIGVVKAPDVPEAFIIMRIETGDSKGYTELASFTRTDKARDRYNEVLKTAGRVYVARVDMVGNVVQEYQECGHRDDYVDWAKVKLLRPEECRNGRGNWVWLGGEGSPKHPLMGKFKLVVNTSLGVSFSERVDTNTSFKITTKVSQGGFKHSSKFKHFISSSRQFSWNYTENTSRTYNLGKGDSMHIWQYVLHTDCYNDAGMFLDTLTVATDYFLPTPAVDQPPPCPVAPC